MVIGIFGENCTGKSTLADALQAQLHAEVLSGKDYLRLAKSPAEAERLFRAKLGAAMTGAHLIYVLAEPEQLAFLPQDALRVLVTADLETIKARFAARMHGRLPPPVAQMLERKHGVFDPVPHDFAFDGVSGDAEALCTEIINRLN